MAIGVGLFIDSDPFFIFFSYKIKFSTLFLNTSTKTLGENFVKKKMDPNNNKNNNMSPSKTIPFQVNLNSDHQNRPIIRELDFFSPNNNNNHASTSAPPNPYIHDHYTPSSPFEMKVNVSHHYSIVISLLHINHAF